MPYATTNPGIQRGHSNEQETWLQVQLLHGRRSLTFVVTQGWLLTLILRHPRAPRLAKLVAACAAAYIISPVQVIPSFIPVIGQLDDLFVLFVGMRLIRKLTSHETLKECEELAESSMLLRRLEGKKRPPEMGVKSISTA